MDKKKIVFLSLVLILSGCSNINMNDTLASVSQVIETGMNNVSSLVPSSLKTLNLNEPKSKYFEIETYRFAVSNDFVGHKGVEAAFLMDFDNKTEENMFLKIEFPVYNLKGKKVTNGLVTEFIYGNGPRRIGKNYAEFSYNEKLVIKPEEIKTSIYMNKKLIATSKGIKVK